MGEPAMTLDPYEDVEEQVIRRGYHRKTIGVSQSETVLPSSEILERKFLQELKVPKSAFAGENLRLRAVKPVTIRLSQGEESWFAENEHLNIYAVGSDTVAAINDFTSHVIHFYQYYKDLQPDRATKRARKLKQLFEKGFVEVA
jgi:hypothetical protein